MLNNFINKFSEDSMNLKSTVNASGRFSFQEKEMKRIVPEIFKILELKPYETLLDIGCNCGDITIPLSFLCDKVTVIDGGGAIERIKRRTNDHDNFTYIKGEFLAINLKEKFDCILAYSVLMYVEPFERKLEFILKAADMLKPGGRLLIGDIVNSDRKYRFANTEKGQAVNKVYRENLKKLTIEDRIKLEHDKPVENILNDAQLMEILLKVREKGFESYLLPQSSSLPFGYTRDDILIKAW